MGETLDEATLTDVLLAVLDSSAGDSQGNNQQDDDDPKAAQVRAREAQGGVGVAGVLPGLGAHPGEVAAAAHYIIKRFGKSSRRAAEEALREVRSPVCAPAIVAHALRCCAHAAMILCPPVRR
jgi:hypothetical protein